MLLFSLPVLTPTRWISHLTVAPPSVPSVSSSPSSLLWTCYFVACLFHPSPAVRLKVLPPARHRDMLWAAIWAAPSQTLPPLCEWSTFMTRKEKLKMCAFVPSHQQLTLKKLLCTERGKNHDARRWTTFLHLKLWQTLSNVICRRPFDLRTLHLALVIISFCAIAFTIAIFSIISIKQNWWLFIIYVRIFLALSEELFWTFTVIFWL